MILRPLNFGSTAINIGRISKLLHIPIHGSQTPQNALVIIGNGTPDDIALAILLNHVDNDKILFLDKPETKRGVSSLEVISSFNLFSARIQTVVFVLDQETKTVATIDADIQQFLPKHGIGCKQFARSGRFFSYQCKIADRRFSLLVSVNGLDDIQPDSHTIEDHFIKASGQHSSGNSKKQWQNFTEESKTNIYQDITRSEQRARSCFPQHFELFINLESALSEAS